MKVELSIRQLELLEGILFDEIIKERTKARSSTIPDHMELVNELETLKCDIWKYRAGIKE